MGFFLIKWIFIEYNNVTNKYRNMNNKKIVRLTESQLHDIIAESVERILSEKNWLQRAANNIFTSKKEKNRRKGFYDADMNWHPRARRGYMDPDGNYVSKYEVDIDNGMENGYSTNPRHTW